MARKRKTISIQKIKDSVNQMIAAEHTTAENRESLIVFLSCLLMDTGNYRGFTFLGWENGGREAWYALTLQAAYPVNTKQFIGDETRVRYF